jgi:hypothetical protein
MLPLKRLICLTIPSATPKMFGQTSRFVMEIWKNIETATGFGDARGRESRKRSEAERQPNTKGRRKTERKSEPGGRNKAE